MRALLLAAACAAAALAAPPAPAAELRTEYLSTEDAIVIQTAVPRFYWVPSSPDRGVSQSAYHILVNNTLTGATVWDSGVVQSGASSHVAYAGATAIVSDTVYAWSVQWTDSTGQVAPWSAPAKFGTGLLTQGEWAPAAWIGCPMPGGSNPNYNQIRAEFPLNLGAGVTVTQARAYVAGMGYFLLRVNGDWAPQWRSSMDGGRPRLDPAWSTYEMRSFYNAFDLTSVLTNGANAIALWMGNGWPDVNPVPGNSTYRRSAFDEVARSLLDPVTGLPLPDKEGKMAALRMEAAGLKWDRMGAQRKVRVMIVVHTSDGQSTTWTSTAAGWERSAAGNKAVGAPDASGWMCGAGALQDDSVYDGCVWDQRLFTTGWDLPNYSYGANWTAAVLASDPGGAHPTTMTAQAYPQVSVVTEMQPLTFNEPSPGVYVFDFGQNFAGIVRLSLPAPVPAGVRVQLRHAELLMHPPYGPEDGSIYVGNLRSAMATDVYTTAGTSDGYETWEPIFTYHGFRFVELSGWPYPPTLNMLTGLYFRSSVAMTGQIGFPNSANVLNQLQHALQWGQGSNLMSVPSDCPQRDERKGWMGDSGLTLTEASYNYDMAAFYTHWALQMADAQVYPGDNHPAGSLADTTPHTFGSYPADPAWQTVFPGTIWTLWKFFGDTRIPAQLYPNLISYMTFYEGCINSTGIGNLYAHYGDWCPPPAQLGGGQGPKPPTSLTSAYSLLVDIQRVVDIATALGNSADAAKYSAWRAALMNDYNTAFYKSNGAVYGNANGDGLQTAQSISLYIGAAPTPGDYTAAMQTLVNDIVNTHGGAWSTGIIGMKTLHSVLGDGGYGNLAIDNLLRTSYPSFGWWFSGAMETAGTTMWELPDGPAEGPGMNSRNHIMFGGVADFLYLYLAGIRQVNTSVGFTHALIAPRVTGHSSLPYLTASYHSVMGEYSVSWSNSSGTICADNVQENVNYTVTCAGNATISAINFASFGLPTGVCGNYSVNPQCNAANSTAAVASLCLGKNSCVIPVFDTYFGDPCYNTVKHFDAQFTCSSSALTMAVTVPTNTLASVRIPYNPGKSTGNLAVFESGSGTSAPVYSNGAYVPGVPGVTGAALWTGDSTPAVQVEVGGGSYSFVLSQ